MTAHLRPARLEPGVDLDADEQVHLQACPRCRIEGRQIARFFEDDPTGTEAFEPIARALTAARTQLTAALTTGGPSRLTPATEAGITTDLVDVHAERYEMLEELGAGGMGEVLRVRDRSLKRTVAMKVASPELQATAEGLSRFVEEAQVAAQLQHPGIVPVHELGRLPDGRVCFTMKEVEGITLADAIKDVHRASTTGAWQAGTLGWTFRRLLDAFRRVCEAMAHAHSRGVCHRDLKPANIMLGAFGEVLVVDWGLAKVVGGADLAPVRTARSEDDSLKTQLGWVAGTPAYMAPEQAGSELTRIGPGSDVYALGAILYAILNGRPPYQGGRAVFVLVAVLTGPPEWPTTGSPIPEELRAICERAMERQPEDRYDTAAQLGRAVGDWLDGAHRRDEALRHVAQARAAWTAHELLATERAELVVQETALAGGLDPWAPLEDKAALRAVRRRLTVIAPDRIKRFSEVLTLCDKALSQDPGNPEARALLATAHYARFEEAEATRDEEARLFHEGRVATYDDGRFAPLLQGTGTLSLRTEPSGAVVVCERYDTSADLVWPLVERRILGRTPLEEVPLEQGSYLLTIRADGKADTRYPVHIGRGTRWDSGESAVPLFSEARIGEGYAYVPPGPFVYGGDPEARAAVPRSEPWVQGFFMSVLPVTNQDYCDFLSALHATDPDQAWSRTPRHSSALESGVQSFWKRPAPGQGYRVPEKDQDGDPWDPNWPVFSVSWEDAREYASWRSGRDGIPCSLPSEVQWEKAARGVDGRVYPWGNGFDPVLCKMRTSRPGTSMPEAVGAFPTDVSPYGVRDVAGGMHQWCLEPFDAEPTHRAIRGGSWESSAEYCRLAFRYGVLPSQLSSVLGFRLVRPAAPAAGG